MPLPPVSRLSTALRRRTWLIGCREYSLNPLICIACWERSLAFQAVNLQAVCPRRQNQHQKTVCDAVAFESLFVSDCLYSITYGRCQPDPCQHHAGPA